MPGLSIDFTLFIVASAEMVGMEKKKDWSENLKQTFMMWYYKKNVDKQKYILMITDPFFNKKGQNHRKMHDKSAFKRLVSRCIFL